MAKEEEKEKGVFECLSSIKKGLEMIKEACGKCGNPGEVPYVVGGFCGLSKRDAMNFVGLLKGLQHAIDERDWERLKMDIYKDALEDLKKSAETMTAAGCTCPPHGLFEPSEMAERLQKFIKEENAEKSLVCISGLCISLLEEAVSK